MERDSFIFYTSWIAGLEDYTDREQGEIILALVKYCAYGVEPDNAKRHVKMAFTYARPQIDANNKRYKSSRFGGAPKGNGNAKKQPTVDFCDEKKQPTVDFCDEKKQPTVDFCDAKKTIKKQPNENENENVNVNVNVLEKTSPIGDEKKSPQKRGFVKPTLDEIRDYCSEKGYGFDPEAFVAFYESNGWKVSRNPMRDWRMACVTWQKKFEEDRRREAERLAGRGAGRASPHKSAKEPELIESPFDDISDEDWTAMGGERRLATIHQRYDNR